MSNVDKVNEYFCGDNKYKKGIYKHLLDFSHSPYTGWSFFQNTPIVGAGGIATGVVNFMSDVATKILLSPVLLPAAALTASLALIGAIITSLAHVISLAVAAVTDCSQEQNEENTQLSPN